MKHYRKVFSYLNVTTPMSCASKFASYVTIIFYFFIVNVNEFFTNPANVTWLNFFFFFSYDQIFVEMFFHDLFTVFIRFKNCLNKFISSIFTSVKNNWFSKFIINTNKFVSKTTWYFLSKNLDKFQPWLCSGLHSKSEQILNRTCIFFKIF